MAKNSDALFCFVFLSGEPAKLYDKSNPDWAPTQNMGHTKSVVNVDAAALSRHERASERAKKRKLAQEEATLRRAEKLAREQEEADERVRLAQRK